MKKKKPDALLLNNSGFHHAARLKGNFLRLFSMPAVNKRRPSHNEAHFLANFLSHAIAALEKKGK